MRRSIGLLSAVVAVGLMLTTVGTDPLTRCANASGRPCPSRTSRSSRPRPNIVFILTDDLSWDLVRYMPSVRRMQREGMTFRQFIVTDPLCCPSRTSIFTGQLPHNSGVLRNVEPTGGYYAFLRTGAVRRSFNVALERAGYRTSLTGKYLNRYYPRRSRWPLGWDDWFGTGDAYNGFNYTVSHQGKPVVFGSAPRDYFTDVIRDDAIDFVRRTAGRAPFYLEISTFAPHKPAVPAPRDANRFPGLRAPRVPSFARPNTHRPHWLRELPHLTRAQIAALDAEYRLRAESVQAVDRMIAAVRAELVRDGVAGNTYVLFSSDNGYHMGQHELQAGKTDAFDTDIRVPLIVVGPGVPSGTKTSAMTQNIDLAPTFLQIAGRRPERWRDGRSLLGILHSGRAPRSWRREVLVEYWKPPRAPDARDPDRHSLAAGDPPGYRALRTRDVTWVEYVGTAQRELYDRRHDPWERHNIAYRLSRAERARLDAILRRLARCHGASCRTADRG